MRYPNLLLKVLLFTLLATFLYADNTPYSYSYTPKSVYKNQVFPVTIFVKHYNSKDKPRFEFDLVSQSQPIDSKPTALINKKTAYYTFYFKADVDDTELTIPQLSIWNLEYTYILNPKSVKIKQLDTSKAKNFSNVLASNLRINRVKIDNYDANSKLVTLQIEATEANLEDIKVPKVIDDGIESIKRDGSKVTANYFIIIPISTKNIEFSYYNLIKNRFETKKISTVKRAYETNNNLAPKDLSFDKLKLYIFIGFLVVFILLAIFTRDLLYIIIVILLIAFAIYNRTSKKELCIQEGANIYILPTQNSNISNQLSSQISTISKKDYKSYHKIEYKNTIGWVKDEDLCKN